MKTLKRIALIVFVLSFFSGIRINAQAASKTSEIKIKTSAECEMCKDNIEKAVGLMKGVKKVNLDVASKVLTVEYNSKKTSPEKIRKVISETGYDADDVKANNRVTKQLPSCCQPKNDSLPQVHPK